MADRIKIVEYSPCYAKAVAEMWNKSGESWGGWNTVITEESIIKEHAGSSNLNVFLALLGEEVVGYCSFSKYAEDEGALYIPLLNARTDHHGKGIGKALVKRAVERTIELGWSRLDLYTWPGNTKAVPVYKKCGFFWERRDDSTHLINLIPYVMQTEAVEDFFRTADWYEDSKRFIEVKPDGIEENKFDYFEYIWERESKILRMEFERRGRGLRLIETDDYIIKSTVENLNLVFGKSYKIYYDIINKTKKPLTIAIKGLDDKNISYSFEKTIEVADTIRLEGDFYVGEISEEQSEWRTHPVVYSEIMINGKKALFKNGILPKYPAKLNISVPDDRGTVGKEAVFYINVESNMTERAELLFELNDTKDIEIINKEIRLEMKTLEKQSIKIAYKLLKNTFYKTELNISVKTDTETIAFARTLTAVLKGYDGMYSGETDDCWLIANGSAVMILQKFDNEIYLSSNKHDEYETFMMYPKLGMPFSTEFSKVRPYKVDMFSADGKMIMEAYYSSEEYKNLELKAVSKLLSSGILEHYYEVTNKGSEGTENDVWIADSIYHQMFRTVIPYEGRFIDVDSSYFGEYDYWDFAKISENWIFSKNHNVSRGISWGKNTKPVYEGWFMRLENNLGRLKENETKKTEALYWAVDAFDSWEEFRAFALNIIPDQRVFLSEHLDFIVNKENPFIDKNFKVEVIDRKVSYLNGNIILIKENEHESYIKSFKAEDSISQTDFNVNADRAPIQKIKLRVDLDDVEYELEKTVFLKSSDEISMKTINENGMNILKADNGLISIKACPQFSNTIHSLKYNNNEWIDTSFPEKRPCSWFNPWAGGIEIRPEKFLPGSAAREEKSGEFFKMEDNFGNIWRGIKTSLYINENETYKGLIINQYFLLLPGVPVLSYAAEFVQNTGKYLNNIPFSSLAFLKPADVMTNAWARITNGNGEIIKHKCGKVRQDIQTLGHIQFGSTERKDTITVVTNSISEHQMLFGNNQFIANFVGGRLSCEDKSSVFTRPTLFILGEKPIEFKTLKDLLKISFGGK